MTKQISKREENRAKRRAEIIRIATRAFLDHGYANVTMSAIAEEVGGSKATLWSHFASKEELLSASIETAVEAFGEKIRASLGDRTYSRQALRRFCLLFLELLLTPDSIAIYRIILGECERKTQLAETFYAKGPMTMRQCVTEFYATRFSQEDAFRLARVTVAALTGFRSDSMIRPAPPAQDEIEGFVDMLLELLHLPPEDAEAVPAHAHGI